MSTESAPVTTSDLFSQFTGAVVDGAKAGLAADLAKNITDMIVKHSGVSLPTILTAGLGAKALPIAVCYLIALASVLVPGFPQAARVRRYTLLGAKGAATVLMADAGLAGKLKELASGIAGLGVGYEDTVSEAK